MKKKLYCAATEVLYGANSLNTSNVTLDIEVDRNNASMTPAEIVMQKLTKYCSNFTMAMTLKHHLQDLLLDTNTSSRLNSDSIGKLSVILTKLQTIANIFDDIQVGVHSSRCVRFTPDQFKTIYKYITYINTSLLQAIIKSAFFWVNDDDFYEYLTGKHC